MEMKKFPFQKKSSLINTNLYDEIKEGEYLAKRCESKR